MTTGQKIYECRKRGGMTQEELADRLGVSRQAVSKWEQDAAFPETEKVLELCRLFHLSSDELLFGTPEEAEAVPPTEPAEAEGAEGGPVAPEKAADRPKKRDVSKTWNVFSILGFFMAVGAAAIICYEVFILFFGNSSETVTKVLTYFAYFAFFLMAGGLVCAVTGLCTKKKVGGRGGVFAILALIIDSVLITVLAMFILFVFSMAGAFVHILEIFFALLKVR